MYVCIYAYVSIMLNISSFNIPCFELLLVQYLIEYILLNSHFDNIGILFTFITISYGDLKHSLPRRPFKIKNIE